MKRTAKVGIVAAVLALGLFFGAGAEAQQAGNPPAAPIPPQILSATKVFIANAESEAVLNVPNLTYNEFYAGMRSWGKYQLVETPADADLIFEVRFGPAGGVPLLSAFTGGVMLPTIRLTIVDPKTHVLLWGFTEYIQTANRDSTARKNFDKAVSAVIDNLKTLTTAPVAATPGAASSN
jgi:hypothetical protein